MDESIFFGRTPCGIPVVVDAVPGSETAVFMVAIGTGSRDEREGTGGISHLLEHAVFRAAGPRTSFQISKDIEGAGGETNAFTGKEVTAYYAATIRETADVAKSIVADITTDPLLREEDVEMEKRIVLQEISMRDNDPESYIHKMFEETIWKGHGLSNDEAGEADTVSGFRASDLRGYFEERYRVPNIAVIASGPVDPDDVSDWASRAFDPVGTGKEVIRPSPSGTGGGYAFKEYKGDHAYVGMGFRTYPADHEDIPALTVLSAIAGSGTSSRLFQSVREEKGLVYSVYSSIDQHSDAGSMAAFMSSTEENVIEAVRTSADTFRRLKEEGLEDGELQRAKNLIKGVNARQMESTVNRCYRMTRRFMLTGRPESAGERIRAIDAVAEEDVMRVAERIISTEGVTLAVYGPKNRRIRDLGTDWLDL